MKTLTTHDLYRIGQFDSANRYYLHDQFQTETSQLIREPSRKWPWSLYKHCLTGRYYKSLSNEQLRLINR